MFLFKHKDFKKSSIFYAFLFTQVPFAYQECLCYKREEELYQKLNKNHDRPNCIYHHRLQRADSR